MQNRKWLWLGALAAAGLACCCAAAVLAGAAGAFFYLARENSAPAARATRDPAWTPAPAPTPGPAQLSQMDAIAAWVSAQRGLQAHRPVEQKFLSEEEVRQRTLTDFETDMSRQEWDDYTQSLVALGLVRPGIDLYDLLLRLYSEGVAGFYDPDTGELVVVSAAGELNAYERTTYAHEYNHALQDQNFDLRGLGFSEEGWEQDSERAAAVQAVLEGDSTLLDEQYQATLTAAEQREYDRVVNAADVSIYYELPAYMLQDFFFPYQQGRDFVERYYTQGGWARVAEVWRNPPASTEHILHPERYEAGDLPVVVARPALTGTLGAGWREIDGGTMGEWWTYLALRYGVDEDARLSETRAAAAAAGWGGDSYTISYNADRGQAVLAWHTVWDTPADAAEYAAAFRDYADKRFGAPQAAAGRVCWQTAETNCLFFSGADTLWIAGPEPGVMEAVRKLYP